MTLWRDTEKEGLIMKKFNFEALDKLGAERRNKIHEAEGFTNKFYAATGLSKRDLSYVLSGTTLGAGVGYSYGKHNHNVEVREDWDDVFDEMENDPAFIEAFGEEAKIGDMERDCLIGTMNKSNRLAAEAKYAGAGALIGGLFTTAVVADVALSEQYDECIRAVFGDDYESDDNDEFDLDALLDEYEVVKNHRKKTDSNK